MKDDLIKRLSDEIERYKFEAKPLAESLNFTHLGVPRLTKPTHLTVIPKPIQQHTKAPHRLHLYADAKKVPGGRVFRLIFEHRTISNTLVRYLPAKSAAEALQAVEQHLHELGNKQYVVTCSEHTL